MSEQPADLKERQQHRLQRQLLTCKHYNGAIGPGMKEGRKCLAGVEYRSHVGGELTGWIKRLPCMPRPADEDRSDVVPCAIREFPTAEEAEAEVREAEAAIRITTKAIQICRDDAKGKRGVAGEVECPKCKGRLHYTVSGYNGHLWGQCETSGCLQWMM